MAKVVKLKVFVTPVGFHDAYVAAPSRKAALRAWGSTHDLFARGSAHEVEDAALAAAPLARPGEVVKVLRGTREEQLAALPDDRPPTAESGRSSPPRPVPPSRAALDAARADLAEARAAGERELGRLAEERRALDRREAAARARAEADRDRLQSALDAAERAFAAATERYRRALAEHKAAR